jgi:hypothetical protein
MPCVVAGATRIVDHGGTSLTRWTLVITGDGFTAAEQTDFEDAVGRFLVALQATAPFDDPAVWFKVEVYRLDAHSPQSGALNPATCGDDPSGYVPLPPATADTCFDATYCTADTRRLLTVDDEAVIEQANAHVPGWDAIVVLVNHQEYGGSGDAPNGIAVCSLAAAAAEIAIHELGHVLGLADEYDDLGGTFTEGEPSEPNVTISLTADKWSAQVTAAALPTLTNASCTPRALDATDPEPGAIGLYAGGKRFSCGIYSPTFNCKMRTLGLPFCVVCQEHLRARLDGFYYVQAASCFVATAVYGDPSHPDVATLRAWRDRHLRPGARGRGAMRLLAAIYTVAGPLLARLVMLQPPLGDLLRRRIFQPWAARLRRR